MKLREKLVEEERRRNRASLYPLTPHGRCRTMHNRCSMFAVGLIALLGPAAVYAADPPPAPAGPAYQIVLRSRNAEVTPTRTKDAQTGGGSIVVEQPEPNTVVVTMGGSAVVGSDCRGSAGGIDFNLEQDLEIIPLRPGVRPPRIGLVGRVVGALQVSDPCKCCGKCCKPCGTAEQGPATVSRRLPTSSRPRSWTPSGRTLSNGSEQSHARTSGSRWSCEWLKALSPERRVAQRDQLPHRIQ